MDAMLAQLSRTLGHSALSEAIRGASWAVPLIQTVHIVAIGFVFAGSLLLALRAVGVSGGDWTLQRWGGRLLPGTWIALLVLLITGALLVTGEPDRSLLNPVFQAKMGLVLVAAALLGAFQTLLRDGAAKPGAGSRLLALLILLVWAAIISAGRWIAYYEA